MTKPLEEAPRSKLEFLCSQKLFRVIASSRANWFIAPPPIWTVH